MKPNNLQNDLWPFWIAFPSDMICWIPGEGYDLKELWNSIHILNLHNGEASYQSAEIDRILFEEWERAHGNQ